MLSQLPLSLTISPWSGALVRDWCIDWPSLPLGLEGRCTFIPTWLPFWAHSLMPALSSESQTTRRGQPLHLRGQPWPLTLSTSLEYQ